MALISTGNERSDMMVVKNKSAGSLASASEKTLASESRLARVDVVCKVLYITHDAEPEPSLKRRAEGRRA